MTDDTEILELFKFEQKIDLRLNDLRHQNRCCDVRFEVNGKIFPCHRVVLIAASTYFGSMLNGNFKESGSDIISLKDIEEEAFEEILNGIYTASIRLLPSNAYTLMKASHLLLIDSVQNACTSYISANCDNIHYLVEIFLLSRNVKQLSKIHTRCGMTMAEDLIRYGQTDSFTQIPVDSFREILTMWQPKSYEEEFTIQLISKWGKANKASCEDIQKLLLASRLKFSRFFNPMLMARYITFSEDIGTEMKNQTCEREEMDVDVHLHLNIYLNVVDVKTGQKGWGVLKMNDKFDTYILSSFHPTLSSYKSVCKVGSMIYCFEYFDGKRERNVFSCYDENNTKVLLPLPEQLLKVYQMAPKENSIYLMAVAENRFIVWVYDCDLKSWLKLVKENGTGKYDTVSAYTYSNGLFYVILRDRGDETLFSIKVNSDSLVVKFVRERWSAHVSYMLYGFDHKLVVCNVICDKFPYINFFDMTSEPKEDGFSDDMNFQREKFCITHHNGFIYAVENNRSIVNEKLNLETKTWEELPSLPKRVTLADSVRELATGYVFKIDSEATEN